MFIREWQQLYGSEILLSIICDPAHNRYDNRIGVKHMTIINELKLDRPKAGKMVQIGPQKSDSSSVNVTNCTVRI